MPKKDNVYLGDGEQEDRTRFSLVKVGVDTGRLNRGFTKQTADSSNKNMDIPPISLAVGRYWRLRYDGNMGHEPSRPLVDRILRFWRLKWREVCEQRTDNSRNITDDEPTGHMVTINSLARKTLRCRRFEAKLPDPDANQHFGPATVFERLPIMGS